jgi:hypothetical protein
MSNQPSTEIDKESIKYAVLVKAIITCLVVILIFVQLYAQLVIKPETVALVIIAALPWLSTIVERIDLPGGGSVKFREVQASVEAQKEQIQFQQQIINQLVVYSMSYFIFEHLKQIHHRSREGGEYLFRNNDAFKRDLRFLRDHGYFEHFNVGDLFEGQNLVGHLKLTPVGNFYVELREALELKPRAELTAQLSEK